MGEGRHVWTHVETLALIDVWEDKFNKLRTQRRTAHVHEEIRQELSDVNIHKSIRQIVVKIDNMTQKYRKIKRSGKKYPTWFYFKRLDKFLGSQSRYPRKLEEQDGDETPEEIKMSDFLNVNNDQNQCSTISITNVQGSEWRSESETTLQLTAESTNGEFSSNRNEFLNIITYQLEVQKQSLQVLEKMISLLKK
ncbi:hypothetical protein TNIN_74321 [Trichonephila inaurata madagascariensis]|uniref:Myb/SANT-like DNA-binding domain-containing protein n=1 Tax=Trichonephila inaurata madagascariensis TaxID=2747483 RepID=A0A8X7CPN6_9ARAC|nr:hypothetical protein TNIN_242541 [Trichonephila inaurata madagascariensis]GFY73490.1 hypothetical protein TNIN_74321 [Trichonephila inaurata madagascariensis]